METRESKSPKFKDGLYDHDFAVKEVNPLNQFANERLLCDYIEYNIKAFTKNVLGSDLSEYVREWALGSNKYLFGRNPAVDFMIETQDGKRSIIECKNPRKGTYSELSRSVSQLLAYLVYCEAQGIVIDKAILLTTKYHPITTHVITRFKLPIELVIMTKEFHMFWRTDGYDQTKTSN